MIRAVTSRLALLVALLLSGALVVGCGATGVGRSSEGRLSVLAAEGQWGSIAEQLGGSDVSVHTIVDNPDADPHDYEPTAADARAFAGARLAIVNGVGYDAWATKLIGGSPVEGRAVVDVGRLAAVPPGGNPHLWYAPAVVDAFVGRISAEYARLDPTHAAAYARRRQGFEDKALRGYRDAIARIRMRYRGTPVGASESIFAPLASALGLRLVTPARLYTAVSEGTDPTAADVATVDAQIAAGKIAVWVFNTQNATPDVRRLTDAARRAGIPVATVTETPTPAGVTFQVWQLRQLRALDAALRRSATR